MSAFGHGALLVWFAVWLFFSGVACVAVFFYQRGLGRKIEFRDGPSAVVIIPIRGATDNLHALWAGLRRQIYRRWRLVFVVESQLDPAHAALARLIVPGSAAQPPTEIVVAGIATRSAQKVHNQLAAIAALRPDDAVVVFADADIVPGPDWLMRLIEPLANQEVWLASGYRWMTPSDHRLSTAYACLMNASIATLPRPMRWGLAWGGSMAIRRTTLEAIDIERWWRQSLSDDLQITRASDSKAARSTARASFWLPPRPPAAGDNWSSSAGASTRSCAPTRRVIGSWRQPLPRSRRSAGRWPCRLRSPATRSRSSPSLRRPRSIRHERRFGAGVARILWNTPIDRRVAFLDRWATPTALLIHAAIIWSTLPARTVSWAGRRYRLPGRRQPTPTGDACAIPYKAAEQD